MAYKVIILYRLYMPSYFLGTFTEYPLLKLLYGDVSSLILFYKQGKRLSCLRNKCYLTSLMTVRGNKKAATCVSYRFLYVCKE